MAEREPEWRRQQEIREQRRHRKKNKGGREREPQVRSTAVHFPPRELRLVLRKDADKSAAYLALKHSLTLLETARKYKYHEPRQLACMRGEIILGVIPWAVAQKIISETAPEWQQGSMDLSTDE